MLRLVFWESICLGRFWLNRLDLRRRSHQGKCFLDLHSRGALSTQTNSQRLCYSRHLRSYQTSSTSKLRIFCMTCRGRCILDKTASRHLFLFCCQSLNRGRQLSHLLHDGCIRQSLLSRLLWSTFCRCFDDGIFLLLLSSRIKIGTTWILHHCPLLDLFNKIFGRRDTGWLVNIKGNDTVSGVRIKSLIVLQKGKDIIIKIHDHETTRGGCCIDLSLLILDHKRLAERFWGPHQTSVFALHVINENLWIQSGQGNC